jgi:small subunit ribosomal protein S15
VWASEWSQREDCHQGQCHGPRSPQIPVFIRFTWFLQNLMISDSLFMEAKTKTIEQFKTHAKDTGSADVQIALLTQRINHLTEHLQGNVKDHSSRRGLLMMVGQRRRLLDYLQTTDLSRYQAVAKKLKLRH